MLQYNWLVLRDSQPGPEPGRDSLLGPPKSRISTKAAGLVLVRKFIGNKIFDVTAETKDNYQHAHNFRRRRVRLGEDLDYVIGSVITTCRAARVIVLM